jgi:DNA-binding protein WhiA
LVTGSFELGNLLYDLLRRMGFPAGFVDRKDSYIVYMKEGDSVIDFLGMLEADEAVESFEVARNVKEVREQVNRLVNCETANLQKAVDAAGRQLAMIRALEAQGKFSSLPPKVRAAAKARLENPDATLQELAEMLGISKSGMNHRMRKLKELAETSG